MDKVRGSIILCFLLIIFMCTRVGYAEDHHDRHPPTEVQEGKKTSIFLETVKSMFSLPTTSLLPVITNYPMKGKALIKQVQAYFFPPNLDFRGSDEAEGGEGEAREKVKEAVVKSFGKSKATVEDSAKLAGETMHKTAKKVTETMSQRRAAEL